MITVENLSFTYRKSKRVVLHDFSLAFESGRVYGLLGKNGAGKSTLLYLMSGLLTPKGGKVMFHDTDVRRRLPVTLQDMFLVPEEFELPPVSLVSYIELNSSFYPRFSKEDMIKYLHYFEMDMDINLGSLSMGQKKKVFMSFALATNTSLLLMDEPTNGLDIPGKSQFRKFIASGMSDDKTIVISTHQVRDIDKVLDHVLIMDESRVLLDESTSSICEKLFFVESDDRELAQTALFAIPTIQGNYLILPNKEKEESDINLELLFNATLAAPEESWKSNVLRIVLLYGVMTVVLVWNGYFAYRTHDSVRFLERHMEADPAWGFILIAFLWFLFGFGCLSGSLTMEKMKSKTNRLSALMTPATPFEKFFSRWLVSTVVLLVVFFITFELADYTRVLVYSLIYPDVKEVILPVNLGDLVGSGKRWYLFHKTYELTLVLSIYCFVQSLFVLGSSVWPKNSFLKTFVSVTIIVLIYVLVGMLVGDMLFSGSSKDYGYIFSSITKEQVTVMVTVGFMLFAFVNWTLAYFRFKESEIVQRM